MPLLSGLVKRFAFLLGPGCRCITQTATLSPVRNIIIISDVAPGCCFI